MKRWPIAVPVLAEGILRLAIMGVLFGACVHVFMNHLGGSAMFCDDVPAGTPGWKWKVPAAWFVIYGVSAFVAAWVSNIAPRSRLMSVTLAVFTIIAVSVLRLRRFHGGLDQFMTQPEFPMGPFGLTVGMIAGSILHRKRKDKAQNQPSEGTR